MVDRVAKEAKMEARAALVEAQTAMVDRVAKEAKMERVARAKECQRFEYQLFQNRFWVTVYVAFACVFKSNASLGWQKVTPVLGIPKGRLTMVCTLTFSSLCEWPARIFCICDLAEWSRTNKTKNEAMQVLCEATIRAEVRNRI